MKSSPDKHFRCSICQRNFTRIDHLKRHHLRHSGVKPYLCTFCKESFARCDNLRDHYGHCTKRGDQRIPETGQRGRRRHACESCTAMKLRCDGLSPCSSCQKRGLQCNRGRKAHDNGSTERLRVAGADSLPQSELGSGRDLADAVGERSSDRGSIKFLLNAGTDSFTEQFRLPPRSDRTRGLEYHNKMGLTEASPSEMPYNIEGYQSINGSEFLEPDQVSADFFSDAFASFLSGPFGDLHKPLADPYMSEISYPTIMQGQGPAADAPYLDIIPAQNSNMPFHEQIPLEPERPFAVALTQSILTRAWTVPLDPKSQQEVSANVNFLLTAARIRKFVSMYFKYWHPSCRIIHMPSFNLESISLPLLASIVFMGAMYSNDEMEVYIAKRILDFAELFIFSSDPFSRESEIGMVFRNNRNSDDSPSDWTQFQNFQAGFLTVLVQYWAGNRASRNRAMESRFSEVIQLARQMALHKACHLPQNDVYEELWVQQESRIRTMNIISSLDCAFSFYQNYPCRLSYTEMECEFPCDESLFSSAHPFAEPNFQLTRSITISGAFLSLFEEYPTQGSNTNSQAPFPVYESDRTAFTVFDMWILIHLLYAFISTQMTLCIPVFQRERAAREAGSFKAATDNGDAATIPDDSIVTGIRTALTRWHDQWMMLKSRVPAHEWTSMGFYKNGYNYWFVSHMLITKRESADVMMQMEVKCEDKLEKLKVLLADE